MKKVIYHYVCADGTASCYAAWKIFGSDAEYIGLQYGDPVPEVFLDDEVYILDFSFERKDMIRLMHTTKKVVVLDHHKTAEQNLKGLFDEGLEGVFDMKKSGAVLAWEYFHSKKPLPRLFRYIQDRDLWIKALPYSDEVNAALFATKGVFDKDISVSMPIFESFLHKMESNPQPIKEMGEMLLAQKEANVKSIIKTAVSLPCGVKAVNCPTFFASDAGSDLSGEVPFACCFSFREEVMILNLRSDENGYDVSVVASQLGEQFGTRGGGHRGAAGVGIPLEKVEGDVFTFLNTIFKAFL